MSKPKGKIIDRYTERHDRIEYSIVVRMYQERYSTTFNAVCTELPNLRVSVGSDINKLKAEVRKAIKAIVDTQWERWLEVEVEIDRSTSGWTAKGRRLIGIRWTNVWRTDIGKATERHTDQQPGGSLACRIEEGPPASGPIRDRHFAESDDEPIQGMRSLLPWTAEREAAITKIIEAMEALGLRLADFLSPDRAETTLQMIGAGIPLLPPPPAMPETSKPKKP